MEKLKGEESSWKKNKNKNKNKKKTSPKEKGKVPFCREKKTFPS